MSIYLSAELLNRISAHGERVYPEEGAGLILGIRQNGDKHVFELLSFPNAREDTTRRSRYLLTPNNYLFGEREAERLGLEVVGVFHSHPDHPEQPSAFDQEGALPLFSYIITSVQQGKAVSSSSWQLDNNRGRFQEEAILITDNSNHEGTYL